MNISWCDSLHTKKLLRNVLIYVNLLMYMKIFFVWPLIKQSFCYACFLQTWADYDMYDDHEEMLSSYFYIIIVHV